MTTPAKPAFIEGPVSGAPQPPNLFALFYCFAHSNFTYHSFLFIETLSKLNLYKTFPNADFPNLHDYHCSESRLFGACELAVYDVTEAKYRCDLDDNCKAFVTTGKILWSGK